MYLVDHKIYLSFLCLFMFCYACLKMMDYSENDKQRFLVKLKQILIKYCRKIIKVKILWSRHKNYNKSDATKY